MRVGAEAAIEWGRQRAEIVLITLDGVWNDETSFSAGDATRGLHSRDPFPPWPGSADIEVPPEGWYQTKAYAEVEAAVSKALEHLPGDSEGNILIEEVERPVRSTYPRDPQSTPGLQATFKCEHEADDGEDIGPLIVWDPAQKTVVWETEE